MKALFLALSFIAMTGCTTLPKPIEGDSSGMKLARITNHARDEELSEGEVHTVFFASYSRARVPLMGGEDLTMIQSNLETLRQRLGDEGFALALEREHPAVRSAVRWHLGTQASDTQFPLSSATLAAAPDIDFEIAVAYATG